MANPTPATPARSPRKSSPKPRRPLAPQRPEWASLRLFGSGRRHGAFREGVEVRP